MINSLDYKFLFDKLADELENLTERMGLPKGVSLDEINDHLHDHFDEVKYLKLLKTYKEYISF